MRGKIKVLHIDTELTWRGGENQMSLLIEGLDKSTFDCRLAVAPGSEAAKRLSHVPGLVIPMRGGYDLRAVRNIVSYCRREDIDIIDAQTGHAHSLAVLAKAFLPRTRLVVHRRVDYSPNSNWISRKKYFSPKVDRYVAISRKIKEILEQYGIPEERIAVVRSAVDERIYHHLAKDQLKIQTRQLYQMGPDEILIGNASALTSQKGYETLLHALSIIKSKGLFSFRCLIAGDGNLRKDLENLSVSLGLSNHVTFLGWIKDVPSFLSSLDILAMPSNFEGLGTLILDATFAGCCVVATNAGGIPEMITHQQSGLLSPVGNAIELAENLNAVAVNPKLRSQLQENALQHVRRNFSLDSMVYGNATVYTSLVQ